MYIHTRDTRYCELYESRLVAFARSRGVSDEEFARAVELSTSGGGSGDDDGDDDDDDDDDARWARRLLEMTEV